MIFTFNEERRLPLIYDNLKDFCQIIVFDGGSIDGTEKFCKDNNINYILRPSNNLLSQENRQSEGMWPEILKFAYEKCNTEYVLHVYCAQFYPKSLLNEFNRIARENEKTAIYNDVVVWRYGRVVHQAFLRRVPSVCVFHKKSIIDFKNTKIHDELGIVFNHKEMIRIKATNKTSLHVFQDETASSYIKKTLKYAEIEAKQKYERGEESGLIRAIAKAFVRFIYSYIRLGSFRFGSEGFAYAILNFQYEITIAIMMWEQKSKLNGIEPRIKNDKIRKIMIENFY